MDRGKMSGGGEGNRNSEHREVISNSRGNIGTTSTKIATVKNKEGRILDNKKESKQRWKQHYEELYNNGNSVVRTVLEELPACNEHEKMLDIMESEVEAAIRSLKKGKAPGEDNIAAEVIQTRG